MGEKGSLCDFGGQVDASPVLLTETSAGLNPDPIRDPPRLRTASDLVTQAMKNGEKFAVKVSTESEQDVRIRRASEEKRLRCMNTSMTWGNLYHLL